MTAAKGRFVQNLSDSADKTRLTQAKPIFSSIKKEECLVLLYPPGPDIGKKYPLNRDLITIGRDSENHVVINRSSVSRRHARIVLRKGIRVIHDLKSTNGTYVNDRQILEWSLKSGDLIKIGDSILKYLSGSNIESAYHEEIYRMTIIDGLTELYNKRYFMEALDKELGRTRRYNRPLSLLMIDIDHFKKTNDTYGHLAGDYVLKELGKVISVRIRREEVLARYGGEEFSIILPETNIEGARKLAEELRKRVERHTFTFEQEIIPVTISIGIASVENRPIDLTQFLKEADDNLYKAKQTGRNKVIG
jgi:diguanylate cyclase (GGDEF)-like protein